MRGGGWRVDGSGKLLKTYLTNFSHCIMMLSTKKKKHNDTF